MVINSFSEAKAAISNAIYGSQVREAMVYALQYILDNSSVDELNSKVDKSNPHSNGKFSHGANMVFGSQAADSNPAGFGYNHTIYGTHAFAVGHTNIASGDESFAEGAETTASGAHAHAAGLGTVASENNQFSIGTYNTSLTYDTDSKKRLFVIGNGTDNDHRNDAFYVNRSGLVGVERVLRIGDATNIIPDNILYSAAIGHANSIGGSNQFVAGANNTVTSTADDGFAEGYNTYVSGAHAHAAGYYTKATISNQFVVGQYNDENSDALFVVGNGSSNDSRSNALEVCSDGSLILGSTIIKNGNDLYDLSLLSSVSQKVDKQLPTPISVSGSSYTTVDGTLRALAAHASTVGDVVITTAIVTGSDELSPTMESSSYSLISNVFSAGKTIILYIQYGASLSNSKVHVARLIERTGDMFETFIFECYSKDLSKRVRYSVNAVDETITGTIIS